MEEVSLEWLRELLGLPAGVSAGFVTGCQMAHVTASRPLGTTCSSRRGLGRRRATGSPARRRSACSSASERHVTVDRRPPAISASATRQIEAVPADEQGRLVADAPSSRPSRRHRGRRSCAPQAGDVNTGAFDPLDEIAELAVGSRRVAPRRRRFRALGGRRAALPPPRRRRRARRLLGDRRPQVAERPVRLRHRLLRPPRVPPGRDGGSRRATSSRPTATRRRDQMDWTPEFSRRARGLPDLRRDPIARPAGRRGGRRTLLRRARRRSPSSSAPPTDVEILNDVVLNQVLVRFGDDDDDDARGHPPRPGGRHVLARPERPGRGGPRCGSRSSNWRTSERTSSAPPPRS